MKDFKPLCQKHLECTADTLIPYAEDGALRYYQCPDCQIIWRDPASIELQASYDEAYIDSKKYHRNRSHKIKKSSWLLDLALEYKQDISGILEIGCSLGNTLEAARQKDIPHFGIDVSDFAVDYCIQQGLNASTQTLEELLLESNRYDLVMMQHVLEHFPDPFTVLRQVRELLRPKGLIMILIPNSHYSRARRLRSKHKFYSIKGVGVEHYVYFNYSNLRRVLNAMGFQVVQENYPLRIIKNDSGEFMTSRIGRRLLSALGSDQELVVIAGKGRSK